MGSTVKNPNLSVRQSVHTCLALVITRLLFWLLGCMLCATQALAAVQAVPALTGPVMDLSKTLTPAQTQALGEQLQALERDTGAQLVVLMVSSTAPEDIFAYSNRVANTWKLGRAGVGDGLLIVVAKDDRRMRIEVAKTLEGAITDIQAGRIIHEHMAPAFRRGDYAAGLTQAVDALAMLVRGEALPPVAKTQAFDLSRWQDRAMLAIGLGGAGAGWAGLAWFAWGPKRWSGPRKLLALMLGCGLFMALLGWSRWSLALFGVGMVMALPMGLFSWGVVSLARKINRDGLGGGGWSASGGSSSGSGGSYTRSSGGSRTSSASSGGFSSGGGGSFGGGGASGRW